MTKNTDRPRILIAEDECSIAICMKTILSTSGYFITNIVSSGKEVVDIALDSLPDLILMDIKLSGEMDGITAYELIREFAAIPVIFISAYTDEHIITRARQGSPCDYLVKPFRLAELVAGVAVALARNDL